MRVAPRPPAVPVTGAAPRSSRARALFASLPWLLVGCLLWVAAAAVRAQDRRGDEAVADPPGRVGRIVELQGNVSRYDYQEDRWNDAERNLPLTTGDRLSTAGGARAEVRIGSTVLRLGAGTEVEVVRLDDDRMSFRLLNGQLALRVRTRETSAEAEILTPEARLLPLRAGHYRVDRVNETTYAAALRGDLRVDEARRLTAITGQRLELTRDGRTNELRHVWRGLVDDTFSAWLASEEQRDERVARSDAVSPEMTGGEDLDRWGTWDRHPEYGNVWYPYEVRSDWAPYRYGRWVWVRPWGWTWVDEAPWGFAPFHYGRWVYWRSRWCWTPGTYVARPVYAPALVAWVGGPGASVSVTVGGPTIGWVPLAPREVYVPYYRVTPVYVDRINTGPRHGHGPQAVPTGPVAYGNQGVPGAVTVVPRDVLVRREPVARAVIAVPEVHRAPVTVVAPPALPGLPLPSVIAPGSSHRGGSRAGDDDGRGNGRPAFGGRESPPAAAANPSTAPATGPAVTTAPRSEPARVEAPPPTAATPRQGDGEGRDRRTWRGTQDGRGGREPRVNDDVRPVAPAPTAVQPAPAAQPAPAVQPAPPARRAPPVTPAPATGAAPAAPAVQAAPPTQAVPPAPHAAPAQRGQPRPERGGGDDDRKRPPSQRHGEREREAAR